ncbi:MAG: leucyl/phenylalanyl-tRNA--protein transferase [Chromatiales bacterium]|jgi:leucyl/phenylalanyl-tRNA--protein transferase|nr:leucyl/phenylalanyl-tRNA--protein transferase [Chromatiales bacterium]
MGYRVKNLHTSDPPDSFPDPATAGIALGAPEGLLAIGGDLSPERLLAAYRTGLFPWFNNDQPILWWSPDPRAVIFPSRFHMSRSLSRTLRNDRWQYSLNHSFDNVIRRCGGKRGEHGTWLTPDMITAYCEMHRLGYAHSVESWYDGEIAGGIYGIRLGKIFFGESMFSARENGSKVALSALVNICLESDIRLIDCQVESSHLHTLGMQEIDRDEFLQILRECVPGETALPDWKLDKRDAAPLAALRG